MANCAVMMTKASFLSLKDDFERMQKGGLDRDAFEKKAAVILADDERIRVDGKTAGLVAWWLRTVAWSMVWDQDLNRVNDQSVRPLIGTGGTTWIKQIV